MIEQQTITREKEIYIYGSPIKINQLTIGDKPICAYLGPDGTYTQQATFELLDDQARYEWAKRNGLVVSAVDSGKVDLGLVPVENSTEGTVLETIKEIIHSQHLSVLAERVLPIHHNLFGNITAFEKQIIHSHPQAIGQCSKWLEENMPNAVMVNQNSTAEAVKVALENGELAIASLQAGKAYGITPLLTNIENFTSNTTRFWLLGRGETKPTGNDRTALLFSFRQEVGKIAESLNVFAHHGVSVNRIDSYPMGALDQYYFLATVDGHVKELKLAAALKEFCQVCLKCKVLGSYRKAPIAEKAFERSAIEGGWAVEQDIDAV